MSRFNAFLQHGVLILYILCGGLGSLSFGLGLLGGTDGLVTLRLPQLWLLVPLGENFVEGSTNDGPLELVGPLGPLFGGLLLNTLPVLASVEDGPCHLPGVALEHVCLLGTTIQETESLSIGLDVGDAPRGVALVPAVVAQIDLHLGRSKPEKGPM